MMRFVVVAPVLLGALAVPSAASAAVEPPPGQFSVASVNGTGCRADDTDVNVRSSTRVDVSFHGFSARQGGGASTAERRVSCVLTLRPPAARGYTFGVDNILLRGRASLPAGATATASVTSWFVGQPMTGAVSRELSGPWDATWDLRRVIRPRQVAWAPCRGVSSPVNIQVEARVGGRAGVVGRIGLDPGTNEPSASYRFAWRRC